MKLNDLQNLFKQQLLAPQADPAIIRSLKPTGKLNLDQAFQIYHRSYVSRLTRTLRTTFEGVAWVLGDALFAELCRRYIETQPSIHYHLGDYGDTFPDFIRETTTIKGIPFLYDLARFEWLYKGIQEAPTPEPLPGAQVREMLSQYDVQIGMIEGVEIFGSDYSVLEIWKRRKDPTYMFEDINWTGPEWVLISKKQKQVLTQRLPKVEAAVIQELQEGISLARAFSNHANELTSEKINQLLELMIRAGIIADVMPLESY